MYITELASFASLAPLRNLNLYLILGVPFQHIQMANKSSQSLLERPRDNSKTRNTRTRNQSAYKTLLTILLLLAVLIGCIVFSFVILRKSHHKSVQSWKVQPSVLLSFLTGIYVASLDGLIAIGITITWWRSIKHGTTLKELHLISAGVNIMDMVPAFIAGSDARRVAAAALVVLITRLTVGPFTQRSTSPKPHSILRDIQMNMEIAQQVPDKWFGIQESFHNQGVHAAQGMFLNSSLITPTTEGYYCPVNSTCSGSVPGAGLSFTCSNTSEVIGLLDKGSHDSTVFSIDYDWSLYQPMMFLITKYLDSVNETCHGTLWTNNCSITSATVQYPISTRNTTLTIDFLRLVNNHLNITSNYTSAADRDKKYFDVNANAPYGPLQALYYVFSKGYKSKATLFQKDGTLGVGWNPSLESGSNPVWPTMFLDTSIDAEGSSYSPTVQEKCAITWSNPTLSLVSYMYDFMFRAAYAVPTNETSDNAPSYLENFSVSSQGIELWYDTNQGFFAASITVMILGLLAAISLLWGCWQLDRCVTLSPLETAKAFGAPVFAAAGRK